MSDSRIITGDCRTEMKKLNTKEEILKELSNGKLNVCIARDLFDCRVLNAMLKRKEIKFDYDTRDFYVE